MTDRQRLQRLVVAAAALADDQDDTFSAYVLGALAVALAEGRERELARLVMAGEERPLSPAEMFPGAGKG